MKIKIQTRNSQGIALVLVLIVILVLGILAGGFAYSMKVETRLARMASFESEFEWLARSAIERVRFDLARQFERRAAEPFDSLKQRWAGGPGDTNDVFLPPEVDLGYGKATWRVEDAERRININKADQRVLQQAMIVIGVDAGVSPMIVDSILDWIDRDTDEHLSGAESDYYQRLNPPYMAKNGWIDDLSELLLVRGVTPEIYWGKDCTNHSVAAFQLRDSPRGLRSSKEPITYPVGLVQLFTPLSSGRVNVNTAPSEVLQAIPGMDMNFASWIIQRRAGLDGQDGTIDDTPFANVGEIVNAFGSSGTSGNVFVQGLQQYLHVQSSVFEVHVDCQIGEFKREYVAWLYRMNQRDLKILTMYWKPPSPNSSSSPAKEPAPDFEY